MNKPAKTNSSPWQPTINYLLLSLLLFEILIVIIYLGSIVVTGTPYPPFDMNGHKTVSSLLQAGQMLAIASISLLLFVKDFHNPQPPSQFFKILVVICLVYAAVDEVWKIHLQLGNWFSWLGKRGWKGIYITWFLGVSAMLYPDLRKLWRTHRRETFFAILGLICFGVGGFGAEIIHELLQPLLARLFPQEYILMAIEKSRIAFEEFTELIAENLILYSSLLFASKRLNASHAVTNNDS
jgi:hypothetical protein